MADVNTIMDGFGYFGIATIGIIGVILIFGIFYYLFKINILSYIFNSIISFLGNLFINNRPGLPSDVCAIIPGSGQPIQKVPSLYLAHIAFFVGFLMTNAAVVYGMPQDNNLSQSYYENRRNRSLMAIILLFVFYIGLAIYRYNYTGCESLLGILFTSSVFLSLGLGWYKLAEVCGARSADIFGIAPSVVSSVATPLVCKTSSNPSYTPKK